MNPYEILDLPPDCVEGEIKRAYKRMAKVHHPDSGGDAAKFAEVVSAYELLLNPERRRKYDETGDTQEEADLSSEAVTLVTQLLNSTLSTILNQRDPWAIDVIDLVRRQIEAGLDKVRSLALKFDDDARRLERVSRCIKSGPRSAFVKDAIRRRVDHLKAEANQNRVEEKVGRLAMELIDDAEFVVEDGVLPRLASFRPFS